MTGAALIGIAIFGAGMWFAIAIVFAAETGRDIPDGMMWPIHFAKALLKAFWSALFTGWRS